MNNSWITLNPIDNDVITENKSNYSSIDELKYFIDESYYNTLLSIRKKEIEDYKSLLESRYGFIDSMTKLNRFDNRLTDYTVEMIKYGNSIGANIKKYFLMYTKDTDFQLKIINKIPSNPMMSNYPVECKWNLLLNFKKLPFGKDFPDIFFSGLDLTDEDIWAREREVSYKMFTKQFPRWLMLSDNIQRMKEEIYEPSTLIIRPMTYNMKTLYDKINKYMKDLKKEFKDIMKQFDSINASFKIMNNTVKSMRKKTLSKFPDKEDYITKLSNSYMLGYRFVVDRIYRYRRAIVDIFIDQFENIKKVINAIYRALEFKDKNYYSKRYTNDIGNETIFYNTLDYMKGMGLK